MPKLADKRICTGCTACASVCPERCIEMEADQYGFMYPKVDTERCVGCGRCEKTCPVLGHGSTEKSKKTAVYAAYSQNTEMRMASSSGGIVSELAEEILRRGGLVFGAAYTQDFSVEHICVSSSSELAKLRGAKYTQSNLKDTYNKIAAALQGGRKVLFIGTPCQTAGLKAFLRAPSPDLCTVDFVCHGVPSPEAWKKYVRFRADADNEGRLPEKIDLRSKHTGWSRYQYSNLYEYGGGKRYSAKSGEDLFMRLFVGDYINRESCGVCPFKGVERVSDFTVGDFWGIWDVAPEMDDNRGTSVVAVHTQMGKELFQAISGRIVCREISAARAFQQNPSMLCPSPARSSRTQVLDLTAEGKFPQAAAVLEQGEKEGFPSKIKRKTVKLLLRVKNKHLF